MPEKGMIKPKSCFLSFIEKKKEFITSEIKLVLVGIKMNIQLSIKGERNRWCWWWKREYILIYRYIGCNKYRREYIVDIILSLWALIGLKHLEKYFVLLGFILVVAGRFKNNIRLFIFSFFIFSFEIGWGFIVLSFVFVHECLSEKQLWVFFLLWILNLFFFFVFAILLLFLGHFHDGVGEDGYWCPNDNLFMIWIELFACLL